MNRFIIEILRKISPRKVIYFVSANFIALCLMNITLYILEIEYQLSPSPLVFGVTIFVGSIPLILIFYCESSCMTKSIELSSLSEEEENKRSYSYLEDKLMPWRTLLYIPSSYRNQYLSPEKMRRIQEKRLRYIVDFAYRNTVLYREKFKEGHITPYDIKTLDDMKKIPFVTKKEMRAAFPCNIVASGFTEQKCIVKTTFGSSSSILKILFDPEAFLHLRAVTLGNYFAQGLRPWHEFLIIRDECMAKSILLPKTHFIPTVASSDRFIEIARNLHPHVILGNYPIFLEMARLIEREGIEDLNTHIVLLEGDIAPLPYRKYIERILGCQVFCNYSTYEMGSIAWECECHRMHINTSSVILEFVKEGECVAPGEQGEIVATNLWNRAMPFIRYVLGDVGAPSNDICECGRALPLIEDIIGDSNDFLVLPSGVLISPIEIAPVFSAFEEITDFDVFQTTDNNVVLSIVTAENFGKKKEKCLLQLIKNELPGMDIDIKIVDSIKITAGERKGAVINRVKKSKP